MLRVACLRNLCAKHSNEACMLAGYWNFELLTNSTALVSLQLHHTSSVIRSVSLCQLGTAFCQLETACFYTYSSVSRLVTFLGKVLIFSTEKGPLRQSGSTKPASYVLALASTVQIYENTRGSAGREELRLVQ